MEFSLYGVLEWALVNAKKLEAAGQVSNILIFLYVLSYTINRKAVFLTAFLLVEMYGNLVFFDTLSDAGYYLGYSLCYTFCYWVVYYQTKSIKICLGYVILVLFELTMSYNEWVRPEIETLSYTYYEYIIMVIHIYIISTITRPLNPIEFSRGVFACLRYKFHTSYFVALWWYNLQKTYSKTKKLCQ